jgi:hypothetical protein
MSCCIGVGPSGGALRGVMKESMSMGRSCVPSSSSMGVWKVIGGPSTELLLSLRSGEIEAMLTERAGLVDGEECSYLVLMNPDGRERGDEGGGECCCCCRC